MLFAHRRESRGECIFRRHDIKTDELEFQLLSIFSFKSAIPKPSEVTM